MKLQRTTNAKRNVVTGTIFKVYQIAMSFVLRTMMIYHLGMDYVGLNSLFLAILQVLNLAELGIGSVMIFSMYKPIAENDDDRICALMLLYKKYYRIIGGVILLIGICVVPVLPRLIKDSIPEELNLYVLYLMNLAATVLSYWLFAYKNCILNAFQRNDVTYKVSMYVTTLEYIMEFIVLVIAHSYYLYLICKILSQIIQNIWIAFQADRMFPQYKPRGELPKEVLNEISKRVRDLFTAKVGGVVVNSADSIVISAFLGISVLAIYNNYYYIMTSIIGFVTIIFNACLAGIGNSLETESMEKNYEDFQVFTFIITWLTGLCTCSFLCLYQPFMMIWVKDEAAMFGIPEVICFCAYFWIYEIVSIMIQYKDAAGIWHEDRFRPLITAGTNLVLNLIMVRYIGILGILLSTIISFAVIGIPWLIRNLSYVLFKRNMTDYVIRLFVYLILTLISCVVCYCLCGLFSFGGWMKLITNGAVCCVIPNVIFLIFLWRTREFKHAMEIVLRMIRR